MVLCFSCQKNEAAKESQLNISIPTAGNSWTINDVHQSSKVISDEGITNWIDKDQIIRTYFYVDEPMTIPFGINAKGNSEINITYGSSEQKISLSNSEFQKIYINDLNIESKGYHYIDMQGLKKQDSTYAIISDVLLGVENDSVLKYVKDDFYFGRRGPSTHLVFETPSNDIEWMYSEIEIDKDQDVQGCYFVANGFGEGYFGIQVNSKTERRILFSIWSPFKTDDPKSIPKDQKIELLNKGEGVTTGEFGNEGSGGQSYKVFNWKSETRYKFLTRIRPNAGNSTDYTAYFFDPDTEMWYLIASFRRPITTTYLTRPYSFLENFIPNTGALMRKGGFYNQWMRDSDGKWYEITEAKFSADATARKDARFDYSGGSIKDGFFLRNCGFTNDNTAIGKIFVRTAQNNEPQINFDALEQMTN
jgi:hypothetical protein